jgi:hypothetical protein
MRHLNPGIGPSRIAAISVVFAMALADARRSDDPFRHWQLTEALPPDVAPALLELPFMPPPAATAGKRETHNAARSYCSVENRRRFAICNDLAQVFQSQATVGAVEHSCGIDLSSTFLRIEYCQDSEGFWLEPHTDIGAKRYTLILSLSDGAETTEWGTDLYDSRRNWVGRAPYAQNRGLAFVPAADTWHGFEPRPIRGVRRSLIVNYVGPEWRARHELSFPDSPAGARLVEGL